MMNSTVVIDTDLVHRLVADQFPQCAHLPVEPVACGGWDNRTFHLGSALLVRLPSAKGYIQQVEKEHTWLPKLAPHLPLPIPAPIAKGSPAEGYPWPWSIYEWIEGDSALTGWIADPVRFALDLADFLTALQRIDPHGAPPAGAHNFWRGGPLAVYDVETWQAIHALDGRVDAAAAAAIWRDALATEWSGAPVWVHGDVAAGNLLVREGRLSAVIDFGCCCVGDPACDLAIAWAFLSDESRAAFRTALPLDDDTWARGRGWVLWKGLKTLAETIDSSPAAAQTARKVVDAVMADFQA